MNWLVYHVASGQAFFTGVALLIVAAAASIPSGPVFRRITSLSFVVGLIAVVVSSTAIPYWLYGVCAAVTIAWMATYFNREWRCWAACATAAGWLIAALVELPYHRTPSLDPAMSRSVTVIGDSITAGVPDEDSETWPSLLARQHQLHVQDVSQMGETAASALGRVQGSPIESSVVIIEIGGNDLLGATTSLQFARDLDALLAHLAAPDRQLMMFELPLPPFCHEYGRIQRTLAARYGVKLIPKRILLSVLASGDATLDTIHLSQSGHQVMADRVWRLVQSAFELDAASAE